MSIVIRRTGLGLLIWFFSLLEVFIYTSVLFCLASLAEVLPVLLVFSRSQFFTLLILSTASLFLMYYLKIFNSLIQLPDILWIFSSPFCNYHGGLRSLKREWIGANLLMLFSVLLGFREGHREGLRAHFCSCVLCCWG